MDERRVKDIPKEERSQLIGQLDANTTFREFFKKTDDFFQREWLGPKRYKLYKEGKFDFDKFFDPEGGYIHWTNFESWMSKPLRSWAYE